MFAWVGSYLRDYHLFSGSFNKYIKVLIESIDLDVLLCGNESRCLLPNLPPSLDPSRSSKRCRLRTTRRDGKVALGDMHAQCHPLVEISETRVRAPCRVHSLIIRHPLRIFMTRPDRLKLVCLNDSMTKCGY